MSRSQLFPPSVARSLPSLYAAEGQGERATVHVKFFTPWAGWTWYVTEGSPLDANGEPIPRHRDATGALGYTSVELMGDWLFYGLVNGFEQELGYFRLSELLTVHGPAHLDIERDEHFHTCSLAECYVPPRPPPPPLNPKISEVRESPTPEYRGYETFAQIADVIEAEL